jgi:tRNA-dihydrouridine synthase A
LKEPIYKFAVAPMMDWTDRHCRFFMRQLSRRALLFTEMITSAALVRGGAEWLLEFDPAEQPLAVQLGGSDPKELARATAIGHRWGYCEVNLNVGCPSDRVRSGRFGAAMMADPGLVGECVRAMKGATDAPVTVKCRLGIDDQDPEDDLDRFIDAIIAAGVDRIYLHARKAWLKGLSPAENRSIPPLDHERVYRLRERIAPLPVVLNGGIEDLAAAVGHLERVDAVMLGRAAYHNSALLLDVDRKIFGDPAPPASRDDVCRTMCGYAEVQLGRGVPLGHITRHMLGFMHAQKGARRYRQVLSVEAVKAGAGPEVIEKAFAATAPQIAVEV